MKPAYVYVLAVGGEDGPFSRPIKIGITKNPVGRLDQIRPCSPLPVSFVELFAVSDIRRARSIELVVHQMLGDVRLSYEWFDAEPATAVDLIRYVGRHL